MANTQTPPSSPTKKRTCCPGKKLVTYSCKVWCMIIICLLLIAAAVSLMYLLLTKKKSSSIPEDVILPLPKKSNWLAQCPAKLLLPEERFDCYPEDGLVDKTSCESRGCCYLGSSSLRVPGVSNGSDGMMPVCVYPSNYGYVSDGKAATIFNGFVLPLRRLPAPSRYGDDIQVVHMKVEMQTKYRLRIKIYDPENYRFEVPVPKVPTHTSAQLPEPSSREVFLYSITYDIHNEPFAIKVRRSDTDAVIFDTSAGALTLSNQYLELTTKLPSFKIFGLGQNPQKQHQHEFNWSTFSMFSSKTKSGSGVHPMYLCLEDDGNAHGVLLLNSNAMEMQLHPLPAVTFRTIGGILDFYLFLGPSPEEVIQQYTEAVGRPSIPPYWALGFHVGQSSYQSTEEIETFIEGFKSKHIPVESVILNQNTLIKVALRRSHFNGFSNLTNKLKSRNQKIIVQLEASIPKDMISNRDAIFGGSLQKDIFITDKWGWTPIEGKFHNNAVVYPDFGSSESISWWSKVIKKIPFEFEGVWLVNNEPTSNINGSPTGCLSDNLNRPPYVLKILGNILYENTLCMDALMHWRLDVVTHYDFHNLYGHSMAMATEQAININFPTKRKLLLSDSTFVGTGQFAGHYIKGIKNTWEGLRSSISTVMESGLYGMALTGISVCDNTDFNNDNNQTELCLRWLQCSIFFPLLQLHGGAEYFYKAGLADKEIFHAVRNALSRRYELLPQLYTLFYLAHTKGSTIVRPLFHNFPMDNETYSISSQFMWGSSILISPVLELGATELSFYVPKGLWYDYYQGGPLFSTGEWFTETQGVFEDTKQPAVLHIRGGHVITLQKPAETTTVSRQNSMSILVALNASYEASGLLYWDDGETKNSHLLGEYLLVEYFATGNSLTVTGNFGKKVLKSSFYKAAIEQVRIMGLNKPPKRIIIDDSYILSNKQYYWNYDTNVLDLKLILIPLGRKTEIKWYF
ncbi:hypothetical protein JTE90_027375 [Oedothorax gibbosus]|uniref:P-type domain-containing protein n=1 Tax=Oedothorax gibbosus TaxID=931172 RepID=A0AAV6VY10_9ARAC|nr:hypothetical protein JTE90_027375 [Oedothorax gibbosus]